MSYNMEDVEYLMAVLHGEEPMEESQVATTSSPLDSEVATTSSRVRDNSGTYTSEDFSASEDCFTFEDSETSDSESPDSTCSSTTLSAESDADIGNPNPPEEWSEDTHRPSLEMPTPEEKLYIENAANLTPYDYFKVFFNFNFLNLMANWINWHAGIVIARPHKPQSRVTKWKDTNGTELLTFLGILFFMGTVKLNRINNYWKKHHLVKFSLGDYMSRNRFLLILRMLYFTRQDVSENIYLAVEPLIDYFHQIMKETVYPGKELVIDESMVLFRGRLGIRQYIKNKRHKFGIKVYILADPQGLVHRMHMYKGSADSEVGGQGHVDKVVLKLFNDYLYAGHSLYLDNFYTSVNLAETLLSKKTFCTGTLQANRKKNPVVVTRKKLTKGGVVHRYNRKGVLVMKWKDKRDVLTLSTEHSHQMMQVTRQQRSRRRRSNNASTVVTSKPVMVVKYNQFMKGVDRHDQMLSYYPSAHKSTRWFKKIGIYILETMLVNAFFLYGKGTGKNISLEAFREIILSEILPPKLQQSTGRTRQLHLPRPVERNNNGCLKRRMCFRCKTVHRRRKTSGMYCPDCDVGLCIECYEPHHDFL